MSSTGPMTIFDLAQKGLSAQMVRMNAAASNLANAGSVAGSAQAAYRPLRPVFAEELDQQSNLATVRGAGVYQSNAAFPATTLMFDLDRQTQGGLRVRGRRHVDADARVHRRQQAGHEVQ